jgi:hypothetical protein
MFLEAEESRTHTVERRSHMSIFKFKIKYKDASGKEVEVEVSFDLPNLGKPEAAQLLRLSSPASVLSIRKVTR